MIGPLACNDGWVSPSLGTQGACSHHGGVNDFPIQLLFVVSVLLGFFTYLFLSSNQRSGGQQFTSHEGKTDQTIEQYFELPVTEVDSEHVYKKTETQSQISCPLCDSKMIKRTARRGPTAGQQFYGCSKYPKCKGTLSLNDVEED